MCDAASGSYLELVKLTSRKEAQWGKKTKRRFVMSVIKFCGGLEKRENEKKDTALGNTK